MVLDTRAESLGDFDRQIQRRGRLESGNARLASCGRAFDKRHQLTLERFFASDFDFLARNPPSDTAIDFATLVLIIERKISVLLKDPNLTHPFGTDSARGDICHAPVLETHARICDVFATAL